MLFLRIVIIILYLYTSKNNKVVKSDSIRCWSLNYSSDFQAIRLEVNTALVVDIEVLVEVQIIVICFSRKNLEIANFGCLLNYRQLQVLSFNLHF